METCAYDHALSSVPGGVLLVEVLSQAAEVLAKTTRGGAYLEGTPLP